MIPKKIHYCWFGGKPFPDILREYMKSWDILKDAGYEIIRWDETNCSFNENEFVRNAYNGKYWGFIGDYYRWKVLYDNGGIYLDTDVLVKSTFDDLLGERAFIGWMYDCALGTAVLGAEKGSPFAKRMMEMYETGAYPTEQSVMLGEPYQNIYANSNYKVPSGEVVTWNVIKNDANFKVNGKKQKLKNVTILPACYLDRGRIIGKEYSRHMYSGLWNDSAKVSKSLKARIKYALRKTCVVPIIRTIEYNKYQKSSSFWKYKDQIGYGK